MKNIDQIRKYISLAAAAALSACMLFGCTRADVSSSSQNVSNGTGSVGQSTVSGGSAGNALAGAGSSSDQNTQTSAPAPDQTASAGQEQAAASIEGQTAQNVSGTTLQNTAPAQTTAAAPQQNASQAQPQQNASQTQPQTDAAPVQQSVPQSQADAPQAQDAGNYVPEGPAAESFTGEFEKSDGSETVVISLLNDNLISFQFSASGIGSTAEANGNTAVYYGEDGYSVSFDVAGDTLGVTVYGEGGDQTVMNGIYYRVLEGGDDQADDGSDEDDLEDVESVDDPVVIDAQ